VIAGLAALAAIASGLPPLFESPHAQGATEPVEFLVDTIEAGTPDADTTDGECATADGLCSLRAAIEQANAVPEGPEVRVGVAADLTGVIEMPDGDDTYAAALMTTDPAAALNDAGAYFRITRTMTVDLGHRVGTVASGNKHPVAAFWVDAPNVHLKGLANVFSNQSSVVFGPTADGSVLEDSQLVNSANNYPRALIRVRPGADDITIRHSTLGRSPLDTTKYGGMIRLTTVNDPTDTTSPIDNLTIEDVTFDNSPPEGVAAGCSASDGRGCSDHGIDTFGAPKLNNLVIKGSTFNHFPTGRQAIDLSDIDPSSSFTIEDNVFTKITTGTGLADATIHLNLDRNVAGPNHISRNVFDNRGTSGQYYAIRWQGAVTQDPVGHNGATPIGNTTRSNTFIEDNHFDGYKGATIMLRRTGTLTVRHNTFGTETASQDTTSYEEAVGLTLGGGSSAVMFMNYDNTSNRRILGWYPESTRINGDCELEVEVKAGGISGSDYGKYYYPIWNVTLDFYYTKSKTAEVYLGSVENLSAPGVVTVPDIPPGAGFIRVQTHGIGANGEYPNTSPDYPESSQYSRTKSVADPAGCKAPDMTLDVRAWTDVDTTTSHDSVIATGQEIPDGGRVAADQPVWLTYTVENTGRPTLRQVVVRDAEDNPICLIREIWRGQTAGCSRRLA
jgi:adhesin/invasin